MMQGFRSIALRAHGSCINSRAHLAGLGVGYSDCKRRFGDQDASNRGFKKQHLIDLLVQKNGISSELATNVVNDTLDFITNSVEQGNRYSVFACYL